MFVVRLTYNTKMGKEEKAVELCKEFFSFAPVPHGLRIYRNGVGPFNKLVADIEFENTAEWEDYFERFWSSPENPEFMERWYAVLEPGGGSEIWNQVN